MYIYYIKTLVISQTDMSDIYVFYSPGLNLAVFRDENGEAHVLDAYCPHLGANIGIGGRVIGDCLQCPFHGWRFRGPDGRVTKIPYADKSKFRPRLIKKSIRRPFCSRKRCNSYYVVMTKFNAGAILYRENQ